MPINTTQLYLLLTILLCISKATAAPLHTFTLLSETTRSGDARSGAAPVVVRTFRLSTGPVIELEHSVTEDGHLELVVAAQSRHALDAMEAHCATQGTELIRSSTIVFSRSALALPGCGGMGGAERPALSMTHSLTRMTSR